MEKIKLYGISGSRALRSLWAAEEIGVDYEQVSVDFMEDSKKPEYLAVNPNGRIPALVERRHGSRASLPMERVGNQRNRTVPDAARGAKTLHARGEAQSESQCGRGEGTRASPACPGRPSREPRLVGRRRFLDR